jgi:hypothetical protein
MINRIVIHKEKRFGSRTPGGTSPNSAAWLKEPKYRDMKRFIKNCKIAIVCSCALIAVIGGFYCISGGGNPKGFCDVGRLFLRSEDRILESIIYQDLAEEYASLNERIKGTETTVFLGDSITKRFNVYEYFPKLPVLNRGIFSDTTEGVLSRLGGNINNLRIKHLFLMIGYNDLAYRENDQILDNISKILGHIRAEKIFVQSLLPVMGSERSKNSRIRELNASLRALCREKGHIYIDLYQHFVNEKGMLNCEYSRDGVHPNGEGYRVWTETIMPLVTLSE